MNYLKNITFDDLTVYETKRCRRIWDIQTIYMKVREKAPLLTVDDYLEVIEIFYELENGETFPDFRSGAFEIQ